MNFKKIFLLLFVFILSGCSAEYNLTLNEDSTINENATILIENTNQNYENLLKLIKKKKIDKKNYKYLRDEDNIKVTYNKKYNNIDSYLLDSYLYKQLFDNIDIKKTNDKIKLSSKVNLSREIIGLNKDNIKDIKDLRININSKLPVISGNYDLTKDNLYSWTIDENTIEKNINITYKMVPSLVTKTSIIKVIISLFVMGLITFIIYSRIKFAQRL